MTTEALKRAKHKYRLKNKDKINEQTKAKRQKLRKFVNRVKLKIGCQSKDCFGYPNIPEVLQFDHIDRSKKYNNISNLVNTFSNISIIKEEIRKCRILCGNCHVVKTINNNEYNKK